MMEASTRATPLFESQFMVFCASLSEGPPVDLHGIFDTLAFAKFPTHLVGFVVSSIASTVDVAATVAVTVESTSRRKTAQSFREPYHLHPGANVVVLSLYELMVAEPGTYLATLEANGLFLARRRIEISRVDVRGR